MNENENLIAYCGGCFNYKGEIADLVRDLRKKALIIACTEKQNHQEVT
jgi:hypothetical protein